MILVVRSGFIPAKPERGAVHQKGGLRHFGVLGSVDSFESAAACDNLPQSRKSVADVRYSRGVQLQSATRLPRLDESCMRSRVGGTCRTSRTDETEMVQRFLLHGRYCRHTAPCSCGFYDAQNEPAQHAEADPSPRFESVVFPEAMALLRAAATPTPPSDRTG